MEKSAMNHERIRKLVLMATFTALVLVLQFISANVKFGPFSITLALMPIVVGGAMFGPLAGAWLGLIFGIAVLITGDAAAFLAVDIFGTVVTVLLKGMLAGLVSGTVYRLLEKRNGTVASVCASIVTPLVNTGVFLLGCLVFFMPTVTEWAGGSNVGHYMIFGLVGLNFLVEFAVVVLLSGTVTTIISYGKKS